MGRIGTVISWVTRQFTGYVKYDPGGRELLQGQLFNDSGVDAPALNNDSIASISVQGTGKTVVVGSVDTKNPSVALQGERRTYSRSLDGTIVVTQYMRRDGSISVINDVGSYQLNADGSVVIQNDAGSYQLNADGSTLIQNGVGSFELQASGECLINGAKITTGGDVITANGVSLNNHPHNQPNDSGGNTEQPTLPPTPTG